MQGGGAREAKAFRFLRMFTLQKIDYTCIYKGVDQFTCDTGTQSWSLHQKIQSTLLNFFLMDLL